MQQEQWHEQSVAQFIAEGKSTYETALVSRHKRVSIALQRHKPDMVSVW